MAFAGSSVAAWAPEVAVTVSPAHLPPVSSGRWVAGNALSASATSRVMTVGLSAATWAAVATN
jgi:hypothetical protein